MKKREKIRVILMGFLMMMLVSGCQKEPASTKPLPTVTPIETVGNSTQKPKEPEDDSKEQNLGSFDMEEVRKNLWINGKQFSLPCTIEDLGEEYYYDGSWVEDKNEDGDIIGYVSGMYSKKYGELLTDRMGVFVKNDDGGNYEKMKIYCLMIDDKNLNKFKIYSIEIGSTDKEVEEKFGKPSDIKRYSGGTKKRYSYYNGENYLSFRFDEKNCVSNITINYLEEEN